MHNTFVRQNELSLKITSSDWLLKKKFYTRWIPSSLQILFIWLVLLFSSVKLAGTFWLYRYVVETPLIWDYFISNYKMQIDFLPGFKKQMDFHTALPELTFTVYSSGICLLTSDVKCYLLALALWLWGNKCLAIPHFRMTGKATRNHFYFFKGIQNLLYQKCILHGWFQ